MTERAIALGEVVLTNVTRRIVSLILFVISGYFVMTLA